MPELACVILLPAVTKGPPSSGVASWRSSVKSAVILPAGAVRPVCAIALTKSTILSFLVASLSSASINAILSFATDTVAADALLKLATGTYGWASNLIVPDASSYVECSYPVQNLLFGSTSKTKLPNATFPVPFGY